MEMTVSQVVKYVCSKHHIRVEDLAKSMGKSRTSLSEKMRLNRWNIGDVSKILCPILGMELILRLSDGTEINLTDELFANTPKADMTPLIHSDTNSDLQGNEKIFEKIKKDTPIDELESPFGAGDLVP